MLRFTLASRLALIAITGFSAVGIAILAVFYLTSVRENELARPSPGRIAAIAELIERSSPDARAQVLDALSSPQFVVRIEGAAATTVPSAVSPDLQVLLHDMYAPALSGRQVVVAAPAASHDRWFPRLTRLMANAIELRIALRTGETLVVEASTRLPVTPFGLPVGFGAGLFGTIVALLALLVMQRETRPLARLAAAVDRDRKSVV